MKLIKLFTILSMALFFSNAAVAEEGAPADVEGTTKVDNAQAKALFDEGVPFIDTREDAAWDLGRIPGAIHLDVKTDKFSKAAFEEEDITADSKVVIYCNGVNCGRSAEGCKKALEWGYKNVYYYREGFPGWKGAEYSVE